MKLTTSAVMASIFLLAASCGAGGQPSENPDTTSTAMVSPFQAPDSAAGAVNSCSYSFTLTGTGVFADEPALVGQFQGRTGEATEEPMMKIVMGYDSLHLDSITPEPSLIMITGSDSAWAYNIGENILEKGALEEGGSDLLRPAAYAIMNEFFIPGPFSDEMASDSVVDSGSRTVAGVECRDWLVNYPGGSQALWSIGIQDNLPRRVERMMTDRQGNSASVVLEISDLQVNSELPDSVFQPNFPADAEVSMYSSFLKVGSMAPSWTLNDREGNTVSLEDLRGNVVILDFWATWCGPCASVMPEIQSIYEKYSQDDVKVYGVNVWESGDPAAFMDEHGYTYGLLLQGDQVADDYKVTGIPTMYVIGPDGTIAFAEVGANPEIKQMISSVVDTLISGS